MLRSTQSASNRRGGRVARYGGALPKWLVLGAAVLLLGADHVRQNDELEGPILLGLNPPLLTGPSHDADPTDPSQANPSGAQDEAAIKDEATTKKNAAPIEKPEPPKTTPLRPLSSEMKALRDSVRQTLAGYAKLPFNTRDNTPANLLHVGLAFGCEGEIHRAGASGGAVNGITCLCWNYPCAGYELLRIVDGRIAPGLGYGLQEHPGQFLATLALARVPRDYPIRAGEKVGQVEDLIEQEKLACHAGADLSFALIGLVHYLPTDATWRNDRGEEWSIGRIIHEEIAKSGDTAPDGGTQRLLALSYAVERRLKRDEPLSGPFKQAEDYVADFQKYALELQNTDGTWHPAFFTHRGSAGTAVEQIRSTGCILRWLALSLPEDKLQDPRIVRSVSRLTELLGSRGFFNANLPMASAREIAARLDAVHALALYDERVFQPFDTEEPAEVDVNKTAQRSGAKRKPTASQPRNIRITR